MFKTKVYKVVCKQTVNEFILGKISGILYALAGVPSDKTKRRQFAMAKNKDLDIAIFRVETTALRYSLMRKHIELEYPGLCRFDKI